MDNYNNRIYYCRRNAKGKFKDYFCWSRKDWLEKDLEQVPIFTGSREKVFNHSFSGSFEFNGTHLRCKSDEKWAQTWFENSLRNTPFPFSINCNTSTGLVAVFGWRQNQSL